MQMVSFEIPGCLNVQSNPGTSLAHVLSYSQLNHYNQILEVLEVEEQAPLGPGQTGQIGPPHNGRSVSSASSCPDGKPRIHTEASNLCVWCPPPSKSRVQSEILKTDSALIFSFSVKSAMANGFLPYHEPGSVYPYTTQLSHIHFLTNSQLSKS